MERRTFLQVGGTIGAGLVIGFRIPDSRALQASAAFAPNAWLRVGTDGAVTVTIDKSEMGEGNHTALAMLLAEELDADWSRVKAGPLPVNPAAWSRRMSTGGSTSVRTSWEPLRKAGAAARAMLVTAAAQTWGVEAAACRTERGTVIHTASGRRLPYGALAQKAATLPLPENAPLKNPQDFRLIGTRVRRLDTPGKVRGSAVFGIDVKVPGMLIASIERAPVFGGRLRRFDPAPAMAVPGVRHVVPLEARPWTGTNGAWGIGTAAGVAVVADTYWQAVTGRRALRAEWGALPNASLSDIPQRLAVLARESGVT
ncbi:MAG: molybdopterin cofactor-binding domain-containing protein, partial [Geminicoccales bacterium]